MNEVVPPILAVGDPVWMALIAGGFAFLTVWVQQRRIKSTVDHVAQTGEQTHALVNSSMLEQKRVYMVVCEALAVQTHNPAHVTQAKAAKDVYEEHLCKQQEMEAEAKAKGQSK